jgi:hypothetical protein
MPLTQVSGSSFHTLPVIGPVFTLHQLAPRAISDTQKMVSLFSRALVQLKEELGSEQKSPTPFASALAFREAGTGFFLLLCAQDQA